MFSRGYPWFQSAQTLLPAKFLSYSVLYTGAKSPFIDREATIPGRVAGVGSGDWQQSGSEPQNNQDGASHPIPGGMMIEHSPPTDRWNLLYLTLVLHGVGTLMPWNIFINAKTVSYVSFDSFQRV